MRTVGRVTAAAAAAWAWRHQRAPAVRAWRPGAGERVRAGVLSARVAGDGDEAVLLLHGLAGSGDSFGAGFDSVGRRRRVVVPDLLGFARSINRSGRDFRLGGHLDALDELAAALALDDAPLVVAGHSLGALLALHWAARRGRQVRRVVAWGPPLFADLAEARRRIVALNPLLRVFAFDNAVASWTCRHLCTRHPEPTGWLYTALNPQLPVTLARQGAHHTWAAYRQTLHGVLLAPTWRSALDTLVAAEIPVLLAAGAADPLVDRTHLQALQRAPTLTVAFHDGAAHDLPLTEPAWCAAQL
jgi:pimeloyl-ACP methyl ester carboxylesterase